MEATYNKLKAAMEQNAAMTEAALAKITDKSDADFGVIFEAQRYSLLGGGKRVRPFLVNECARMLGADVSRSMPLACALEMVHTYSLIHDDLPCMDNDDYRRGKPTNHKKFGYANALLAGDALLTGAFQVIAEAETIEADLRVNAVKVLSSAAGDSGMIAGQVMDLFCESQSPSFDTLLKLHALKTAKLMECAVKLGAIAAGYDEESHVSKQLAEYARCIGVAFQAVDDVLDKISDEQTLGKTVGSDAENNKTTFLTYYTVEETLEYARGLTSKAINAVSELDGSELLCDFACYLLDRKS